MSLVTPDSTRMNDKVRKPFLEKYWPHCYGLGIALIIYMRSRAEVSAWSATLGGIGFVLLLMGSAGIRDFNRERKASQADPVPKPITIVEAPTPTIVNDTPCQTRSSKRWIERLRKAPLSSILIFLYAIAAVFEMLRVPTTAGDRWIWQLEFENIRCARIRRGSLRRSETYFTIIGHEGGNHLRDSDRPTIDLLLVLKIRKGRLQISPAQFLCSGPTSVRGGNNIPLTFPSLYLRDAPRLLSPSKCSS